MTVNELIEALEQVVDKQMLVRFTDGTMVQEVDVVKRDYPDEGFNYIEIG